MLNLNDKDRRELSRKHGRVINTVEFREGGVAGDVFLNKEEMMFSAFLCGKYYQSKDGKDVNNWVYAQLQAVSNLTWMPVISVLDTEGHEHRWGNRTLELHHLSIDIHRFYVTALPDKTVRAVDWDIEPEERLKSQNVPFSWIGRDDKTSVVDGKIKLPLHSDELHILPYTETLWTGLSELVSGIDRLRKTLHTMLKTDDGIQRLELVGAKMLNLLEDKK